MAAMFCVAIWAIGRAAWRVAQQAANAHEGVAIMQKDGAGAR